MRPTTTVRTRTARRRSLTSIEPTLNDAGARLASRRSSANNYTIVVTSNRDSNAATFTLSRASTGTTTRIVRHRYGGQGWLLGTERAVPGSRTPSISGCSRKGRAFGPALFAFPRVRRSLAPFRNSSPGQRRVSSPAGADTDELPMLSHRANSGALAALTREDGFTLIELLVVLIIIGLLAAIAIAPSPGSRTRRTTPRPRRTARTGPARDGDLLRGSQELRRRDRRGAQRASSLPDGRAEPRRRDRRPRIEYSRCRRPRPRLQRSPSRSHRSANGTIAAHAARPPNTGGCKGGAW